MKILVIYLTIAWSLVILDKCYAETWILWEKNNYSVFGADINGAINMNDYRSGAHDGWKVKDAFPSYKECKEYQKSLCNKKAGQIGKSEPDCERYLTNDCPEGYDTLIKLKEKGKVLLYLVGGYGLKCLPKDVRPD